MSSEVRPAMFFLANGVLSAISDNVFVATVYISEIDAALKAGEIDRAVRPWPSRSTQVQICPPLQHPMGRQLSCSC